MKKVLVVDSRLLMYRLFHQKRPIINTIGYLYNVASKYGQFDKIFFAWDSRQGSKRRLELYPEYKQNRKRVKRTKAEVNRLKKFNEEYNKMEDIFNILGNVIHLDGYEADDIANLLAKRFKGRFQVTFVSSDIDWGVNLIDDNYRQLHLTKGLLDKNLFIKEFNINPIYILQAQAIMGVDKENILGVYKLGIGRLYPLFNKFNDVNKIIDEVQAWVDEGKYGLKLPDGFKVVKELYEFNYNVLRPIEKEDLSNLEKERLNKLLNNSKVGTSDDLLHLSLTLLNQPYILSEQEKIFYQTN